MHVCVYVRMYVTSLRTYACRCVYVCMYVCMNVFIYVCKYICMCVHIYIYIIFILRAC